MRINNWPKFFFGFNCKYFNQRFLTNLPLNDSQTSFCIVLVVGPKYTKWCQHAEDPQNTFWFLGSLLLVVGLSYIVKHLDIWNFGNIGFLITRTIFEKIYSSDIQLIPQKRRILTMYTWVFTSRLAQKFQIYWITLKLGF